MGRKLRAVSCTGRGPAGAETRAADLAIAREVLEVVEEQAVVCL